LRDGWPKKKFIAIGETGLDFYWDLSYKDQQFDSFQRQIEWAIDYGVPVVIHSRNSTDECINMITKNQTGNLKGVFHCFSGSLDQAQQIIDLGFYLGIGGVVTFKNSGLDKVIEQTGLDRVVLETDAPYLAPVPFRGKRNEPAYLKYIVEKLTGITKKSEEEIASITTANAQKLFDLSI
jgi:TatD DNase family protein